MPGRNTLSQCETVFVYVACVEGNSDKENMMCQFVSLTPSSSLPFSREEGGGGFYGGVEGDCALPKVKLVCVGRG